MTDTRMTAPRMTATDWALLLLLSVLWGGSFFFAKVAVAEVPPLTLVLLRVGLAALALHAFLRLAGIALPRDRSTWGAFLAMGLLNNVIPFALIFYGQTEIGSGLAAVINGMTPFWAALMARSTGAEPLGPGKAAGILIGFAGLAAVIGPAALDGLDAALAAQLAVVGATVSYGAASVYGRRFRALPPQATAAGQLTASTLAILPLALVADRPWTLSLPGAEAALSVIALALASTALAYILYFRILASAGATNVALVTLLVPVSAILLGAGLLGEPVAGRQVAGMGLIALGLAAIDGRPLCLLRNLISIKDPAGG